MKKTRKLASGGRSALTLGDNPAKDSTPSALKLWVTMFTGEAPGE